MGPPSALFASLTTMVRAILTLPKLVEYFRERWRQPLAAEVFSLQVVQGRRAEWVRPGKFEGDLFLTRVRTNLGFVEFELYIGPRTQAGKRVSLLEDCRADRSRRGRDPLR